MEENFKITRHAIRQIEKEARAYFKNASGCHDWTHVERVRNLALYIGEKEHADLKILEIAAFLHDIGRKKEMEERGLSCHAKEGAKIAEKILRKYKFPKVIIDRIKHCILSHRNRNSHIPETIEAKVLYDADKLDSIGAIGIARDFLFAGNAGSKNLYTGNEKKLVKSGKNYSFTKEDSAFLEYELHLKYIKRRVITKEGKRIAMERHKFMEEYFKRFWQEVKGKL